MSIPSPLAEDARELYLAPHGNSLLALVPDCQNVPTVIPSPNLLRTAYLSNHGVTDQNQIQIAANSLGREWPLLMMIRVSNDGAPFRSGIIFFRHESRVVSWRAESLIQHGLRAELYLASTSRGHDRWKEDAISGQPAYFLTGLPNSSSLWRITRMEPDAAFRLVFTLAPVKLAHGLPHVQFAPLLNPDLRAEAEQHWSEFKNHLMQHQYYALVTSAKNVAETILAAHLSASGISFQRDFNEMLQALGDQLSRKDEGAAPFSYLDYHLMHKIRLLHARTHPGRVASMGRAIKPEFALTIAEDLVEILTSFGYADSKP
jgi:hypothetical protein